MGKITVSHYLHTKVKPIIYSIDNKEYYPIYTQITFNRKTTQIRSFTTATATIEGFSSLYDNSVITNEVLFTHPYNDNLTIIDALAKEKKDIEQSIEYILAHKMDISKRCDLKEVLKLFFVYVSEVLIESTFIEWLLSNNVVPDKEVDICDAFNERFTIYQSINLIKKHTKIDLSKNIDSKIWELSKSIYFYLKHTDCLTFIDLVKSDYKSEINSIKSIKNKKIMIEFIDFAISNHILYYQLVM